MAQEDTHHFVNNRIPLSLRLPERVVQPVDEYAHQNHINRTEAFLHFIELGLGAEQKQGDDAMLRDIHDKVDEILKTIKEQ